VPRMTAFFENVLPMKRNLIFLAFLIILAACGPVTPVLLPTATALPASTPQPSVIPAPTWTKTPTPYQSETVAGLLIVTREGVALSDPDPFGFMTLDAVVMDAAEIGEGEPFTSSERGSTPSGIGVWANLGNDKLIATYDEVGWVTVTRNKQEIYKIFTGDISPITPLRSLWVYDNHWVLETAFVKVPHYDEATGQITLDGELLNEKQGYEEAFNFQTINDRPFYFFKKDGKIDAWYDGQVIPLGYDEINHYACCSAAELNPMMWKNMVTFFSTLGKKRFLVKIGVPGTFKP
jgi:hypothetical protein